jgi:acyl transferase domain-containing protein/acyl carrier protein
MNNTFAPIAIVGMGCRFPKGLESMEALWSALCNRQSAIDTVPPNRWTADRYFSSNPIAKGKSYIRRGGFLTHPIETFDPTFFGISPRDAENMDPQQRLLLEVVWEAFENAGIDLPAQAGKAVGVYVGGFMLDHMISQMSAPNRSAINQYTAAGMMMTMLSNRISHTFDLRGPSLSIDTACSSSLVAFHYACQDIWRGDTTMAIVGGANCMLRPEYPMGMCKGHFLSRDGECKSFDERADGYGRGEGAGAVLLKPLHQALVDGDMVLATVLATGANQDGHTPGISMPNGDAQRQLILDVCQRSGIDPRTIDYVECHGTGTAIGDPTETKAIADTYGKSRDANHPVVIGSIKSCIGHLEAAAGVAGIIKAVLTLMHRQATPITNLQTQNSAIDSQAWNVLVPDQMTSLGTDGKPIRCAVNSFGYGGSNAHVILESATTQAAFATTAHDVSDTSESGETMFLPLSARSPKALAALASRFDLALENDKSLRDMLFTASHRRAHLSHRAMVHGCSRTELRAALQALANNVSHPQVATGTKPYSGNLQPVFVFTGMGPQWWAMGQELYRSDAFFRDVVEFADRSFQSVSGFSILAEMLKSESESQITRTEFAQPANFLIQIGIAEWLRKHGVEAGAVVGHSVGELASSYFSGVLSLDDAMLVSFYRSQLQAKCIGTGAMLAVGMGREDAESRIQKYGNVLSIAAVNGPTNITVAGDADAIADWSVELAKEEVFHKKLDVEVPYHSPMMDPILPDLAHALARLSPKHPTIPLYSTVTGKRVHEPLYDAVYWTQNVRKPVEFESAVYALVADGRNSFLEIGPHPVLSTSLRDCCKRSGKEVRQAYTLRRGQPEMNRLRDAVASVFAMGCDLDWSKLSTSGSLTKLPNYPWQREHFWVENDRARQDRIATIQFPMLGIQEAPGAYAWRNDFDHEPMHYLKDHIVAGISILPAAGYIESMLELTDALAEKAECRIVRNLEIASPIVISAERGLDFVTSFEPKSRFATIRSLENGKLGLGQTHATAFVHSVAAVPTQTRDLASLLASSTQCIEVGNFYRDLNSLGLQYGPAFQTIQEIHLSPNSDQVISRIELNKELHTHTQGYRMHPALLDACFQSLMAMLPNTTTTYLPTQFREIVLFQASLPERIWCIGRKISHDARAIECDIELVSQDGSLVGCVRGLKSLAASSNERRDRFGDPVKRQILAYDWQYDGQLAEPKRLGHWMMVGQHNDLSESIGIQLENFGATVVAHVSFGESVQCLGRDYTVRPAQATDLADVFNACGPLDGILFLDGLQSSSTSADPTGETAIHNLACLIQAGMASPAIGSPRLYVLTQNAFATDAYDDVVEPGQAAINGFVRVAFNEIEGLRATSIDLPHSISETTLDTLVLELVCDDNHDEVALRNGMRLVSELRETNSIFQEVLDYRRLSLESPVLVRATDEKSESQGTAKLLATHLPNVPPQSIAIRVEATPLPKSVLSVSGSPSNHQLIEIVGEVLQNGTDVTALQPGQRVVGFVPFEIASHRVIDPAKHPLQIIDGAIDAPTLVHQWRTAVRMQFALNMLDLEAGERVLVESSALGRRIGNALKRRGVEVFFFAEPTNAPSEPSSEGMSSTPTDCGKDQHVLQPHDLHQAYVTHTHREGFAAWIGSVSNWKVQSDFYWLRTGATLIDLDEFPVPMGIDDSQLRVVRTNLEYIAAQFCQLKKAMSQALPVAGERDPSNPFLEVSVVDLAWQKLPLDDVTGDLVLSFETQDRDLPMVRDSRWQCNKDGTYLITGGLGGLGYKTAEWLISLGARSLVLTSRSDNLSSERENLLANLRKSGCKVHLMQCDSADEKSVQALVAKIEAELPPLRGVIHSGAMIIDEPILEITPRALQDVMRSKAMGAWNFHKATKSLPLDFFVMYSSVANLVGNSRQSIYSAANGFLNGLAHHRQALGMPSLSINLGAISDVGVVARDEKLEQFLRYTGLRGMSSQESLQCLQEGISRAVTQFGVTLISNWGEWARFEVRGGQSPRFASLIAADSGVKDTTLRDAFMADLIELETDAQSELISQLLVEVVASVLKADVSTIPQDRALNQLGIDSLMATEVQLMLDAKLGINVSVLSLISDATIRDVAAQIRKALFPEQSAVAV